VRIVRIFVRRAIGALGVLLGMITITFVIFWAVPNEPASFIYPNSQHLSDYQIQRGNHLLGTDRPKLVQFGDYLWHLAQGDLGTMWSGAAVSANQELVAQPIAPQLLSAARVTGSIILGGAVLVLLLAAPLGALAARFRYSAFDRTISLVALVGICTHPMVVGLVLRTVFGDKLHWLPSVGYCPFFPRAEAGGGAGGVVLDPAQNTNVVCGGPVAWAEHLVLPWLTFALLFLALYTQLIRASVADALSEDYVRTARAKGASETRILVRHALPNAALPVLTLLGIEIATALGIVVYIESAFGMHGLGRLAVNVLVGTVGLDLPLILATVTLVTLIVLIGNLVVDTLYAVLDPRAQAAPRAVARNLR
jgi:peptide/nickel transport system permease protein